MQAERADTLPTQRPWPWALLWGALLGVLFFSSYGAANHFTARRHDVGIYVFPWEHLIPFWPWTILPYWSIDFLYGASLFLARSKAALMCLVRRLLCAQLVCIAGFLLWPLQFSFPRPSTSGWSGALFDVLTGFDLPYNQAPSLHICLLLVLWRFYADILGKRAWRGMLHIWFALIGVSVLTTYQHHFIDLLTGLWAGALCVWLNPETPSRWHWRVRSWQDKRLKQALGYLLSAVLLILGTQNMYPHPVVWPLYWLASALIAVTFIYLFGEGAHFGRQGAQLPWHSWMIFGPYLLGARLNVWGWTRRLPHGVEVLDRVYLGRQPDAAQVQRHQICAIVDLCAELPLPKVSVQVVSLPMLDLLPPESQALQQAAQAIEHARRNGPVWVCCALGFSRSAASVAAWLICYRGYTLHDALACIRKSRPQIVLSTPTLDRLRTLEAV